MIKFHFLQKNKERIDGEEIVYHGSMKPDMKEIAPNKCKHDKAYVYASENIALCVIFGLKRKGENIDFGVSRFGKTFIREFYPGGFEDRFKGRACYLYKLNKKDFSYETEYIELVSTKPVKVVDCIKIEDASEYLLQLEKQKQLKIYRYEKMSKKDKREVDDILRKRIKEYLNLKDLSKKEYESLDEKEKLSYTIKKERKDFCLDKFPEIVKEIKEE